MSAAVATATQLLLHLHRNGVDNDIECQFGQASTYWGVIARWFEWGCRELVISDIPNPEGRGQRLRREDNSPCVFMTDAGILQILLPIDGHPALNGLSELWIWPRVPFPGQHLSNPATDTASPILAV